MMANSGVFIGFGHIAAEPVGAWSRTNQLWIPKYRLSETSSEKKASSNACSSASLVVLHDEIVNGLCRK